jgi:hypothetical protein
MEVSTDTTGDSWEGPAESPLISYPAIVVGDFVRIDLANASRAGWKRENGVIR